MPPVPRSLFGVDLGRRALLRLAAVIGGAVEARSALGQTTMAAPSASRDDVWKGPFNSQEVFGYADRLSIIQGERFSVMLSRKPGAEPISGRLRFHRVGDYPRGRKAIWASGSLTVEAQVVLRSAAASGAAWPPSAEIATTDWAPGCYTADFERDGQDQPFTDLIQIIVRPPRPSGGVLLKLSANTWQAYNPWGGHSLYPSAGDPDAEQRGVVVSFDRPTPPALFEYEVYIVRWLEGLAARHGFSVDYATNFDIHSGAALLDDYPLVICGSHDEYWSREEFDAFERRIHVAGRNTIFFGGNTAYWQVRYADFDRSPGGKDCGRQLVCHKSLGDPIVRRAGTDDPMLLVTARFRDAARRPETMLLGAAYQNWFEPRADGGPRFTYRVARTDAPFFEGTGLRAGDQLADVIGYEWDNRDPDGDGLRLWSKEKSRIRSLPLESIKVLFSGRAVGQNGKEGQAEAVYFVSPAGAKVFNAGSIRWAWGLGREGFETEPFKRFNENLVLHLLRN